MFMKNALRLTIAAMIYGAGVGLFLEPNNLAPGGVVGISIILNHFFGAGTGTFNFLINIPILSLGFWCFGKTFMLKTAYVVMLSSVVTNILSGFGPVTTETLLAAVAGSMLTGLGIGLTFLSGATTGGMDIIVKLLRRRYPYIKTNTLFILLDFVVVTMSGIVFRDFNLAMYALIAVFVVGRMLDYVLYGQDEARMIYIVSSKPESIVKRVLQDLNVGATYLKGMGAYSGQEKNVILCVVRKRQAPLVGEIVKNEDRNAFLIITSASEIYGEGYKNLFGEVL